MINTEDKVYNLGAIDHIKYMLYHETELFHGPSNFGFLNYNNKENA